MSCNGKWMRVLYLTTAITTGLQAADQAPTKPDPKCGALLEGAPQAVKKMLSPVCKFGNTLDGFPLKIEESVDVVHGQKRKLVWDIMLRGGKIRVTFLADFPFSGPPQVEAIEKPLYDLVAKSSIRKLDKVTWTPAVLTLATGLLPVIQPKPEPSFFAVNKERLAPPPGIEHGVAYICIGCGGPVMKQKYPHHIQTSVTEGKYVSMIFIDPFLTFDNESAIHSDKRHTIAYVNEFMDERDYEALIPVLQQLHDRHFTIHLADHRGTKYGPIDYPLAFISLHLRAKTQIDDSGISLISDPILADILKTTVNKTYEEIPREILNMSHQISSCYLGPDTPLICLNLTPETAKEAVDLDGGQRKSYYKRMTNR